MTRSMRFGIVLSGLTFRNDAKGCFETTFLSPSIINPYPDPNPNPYPIPDPRYTIS